MLQRSKLSAEALYDGFWRPRWGLRRGKYGPRGAKKGFQSAHSGAQDRGDAEPEDQGPKREGPN